MSKNKSVSRKTQQKFRTSPENLYFYIIREFHSLSEYEKEICLRRMYNIYLSGARGLTYDEFRFNIVNRKGKYKILAFFKEKTFNTDIGFDFCSVDEISYKENDYSNENSFLVLFDLRVLLPHFSGGGLGLALYSIRRKILLSQFPGHNIVGFQRFANPALYEMCCSSGCVAYPTHLKPDSPELDKFYQKLMKHYGLDKNQVSSYVINMPFRLINYDPELSRIKYKESSDLYKYFIDQTNLKINNLLVTMVIENLVKGNTLEVPEETVLSSADFGFEFRLYDALLQDLSKL